MENNLLEKYRSQALKPTLDDVIAELDFTKNYRYPKICAYLVEHKICTARQFNSARYTAYVVSVLGSFPETAAELVEAIVEIYQVESSGNSGLSFIWTCPTTGARRQCDETKIVNEAHRINDTVLENRFPSPNISRAVSYWIDANREIFWKECCAYLSQPASFDWKLFAATFFDDERINRTVQTAVFQKFIWQVKRRMSGLPVTNHLMVVIYGKQGKGKSKAVEIVTAPMGHLVSTGDFQRLGDSREVAMFQSYVVVLDEMQKASHADVDRIKNVITRDHFNYRPMHSNSNVSSVQNATFIGTSNRALDQIIHDPTGNRRFFQVDWSSQTGPDEWAYLNSLCIEDMWRSVDQFSEDPTIPFLEEIREIQSKNIYRNSVGQFFDAVTEQNGHCYVQDGNDVIKKSFSNTMRKEDLFHAYRGYCEHMKIKNAMEPQAFYYEVRRIVDQENNCPFAAVKLRDYNGWRYIGPKCNAIIQLPTQPISLTKRAA